MHLHENETRKRAFGLDARLYDAVRHRYPAALIERVTAHARLTPNSRALELGSGTGIATLPFAHLGCAIHCLELSDAMAAVARAKLAAFPRVRVVTTAFEDWVGESAAYDLVFCAQAWHWLPPEVRYRRTSDVLRAGGTLAVFANWDAAVLEEVQPVYVRHGLVESRGGDRVAWGERDPPDVEASIEDARASVERSGAYTDVEFHRFPWSRSFDARQYVDLLRTFSDVSTRPSEVREPFLVDIAHAIDGAGGSITRYYEAVLVLARPTKERA